MPIACYFHIRVATYNPSPFLNNMLINFYVQFAMWLGFNYGLLFVNPNLVLVIGLRHHGPFANYQEFLIRLLFLVSSAFKDKNNPFAQLGDVSSMERSPSIVVSYLVCEDMCNQIPSKKRKLYDSS
jgi:hypothetical protein